LIASFALIARYIPIRNHLTVFTTALFPFISLTGLVSIVFFAAARRWILAAVSCVVLAVSLAVTVPLYVPAATPGASVTVRVITANIYLGQADTDTLVAAALQDADLLAVQELTPQSADRISAGLSGAFPHRVTDARDQAGGVGLWSRYPLVDPQRIAGYEMAMVASRLRIAGVADDPTVIVAHISGPWPQAIDDWQRDMRRMAQTMQDADRNSPAATVIVMGDFNSTLDMWQFRNLLREGYRDAAQQAGSGSIPTYPGDRAVPPIIAIDHVITKRGTAADVSAIVLPGSDHRGLRATINVPRSPGLP
jgi:endonuclease/exonuclease/phosphatase (EEP) superfamily protein YafD